MAIVTQLAQERKEKAVGKSQKQRVEFESRMELEQVVSYLESLLDGLRSGTLHVEHESSAVTLHPHSPVKVEVEAKQKEDKESIEIEIKWYRQQTGERSEEFQIADTEPAAEAAADSAEAPIEAVSGDDESKDEPAAAAADETTGAPAEEEADDEAHDATDEAGDEAIGEIPTAVEEPPTWHGHSESDSGEEDN